jgi:hypothetical protein
MHLADQQWQKRKKREIPEIKRHQVDETGRYSAGI